MLNISTANVLLNERNVTYRELCTTYRELFIAIPRAQYYMCVNYSAHNCSDLNTSIANDSNIVTMLSSTPLSLSYTTVCKMSSNRVTAVQKIYQAQVEWLPLSSWGLWWSDDSANLAAPVGGYFWALQLRKRVHIYMSYCHTIRGAIKGNWN